MNFSFRLKPNHCSQSFDYIFDSIRMATDYCHSCDPICGLLLHLCHNYERNGLLCACISLGCIHSSGDRPMNLMPTQVVEKVIRFGRKRENGITKKRVALISNILF